MSYLCDLHTHSTASDGQYTPSELVMLAKKNGIDVLALTDHDTTAGLREAVDAGREYGIRVVPGIELSAREYQTFHILGYGIVVPEKTEENTCENLEAGRRDRAIRIISWLAEKEIYIDLGELEEIAAGVIGRQHFAQLLVKHGYVKNDREAFNVYLDTNEFHERIEVNRLTVRQCIDLIKSQGGKVSLAHPYQIGIDDAALDKLVGELKEYGLDAIECYYPRLTEEQERLYRGLAKKYGLHETGGSDFHGEKVKPDIKLASLDMDLKWLLDN